MRILFVLSYLLLSGICLPGCSQEQAQKLAEQVAQEASGAAKKVGESIQDTAQKAAGAASQASDDLLNAAPQLDAMIQAGSTTMQLGSSSYDFAGTYCQVVNVSQKHGSVLQIQSYASLEAERFPSYFFQAEIEETQLTSLVGTEIQGQLFVQVDKAGPVWHSGAQPVSIELQRIDGSQLTGQFSAGKLYSADNQSQAATGTFQASIQQ